MALASGTLRSPRASISQCAKKSKEPYTVFYIRDHGEIMVYSGENTYGLHIGANTITALRLSPSRTKSP